MSVQIFSNIINITLNLLDVANSSEKLWISSKIFRKSVIIFLEGNCEFQIEFFEFYLNFFEYQLQIFLKADDILWNLIEILNWTEFKLQISTASFRI